MSRRAFLVLGFFAFTLAMLPGCGRGSGKIKVAFVSNNAHNFWTYAKKGCEKAGKDLGIEVDVKMPNPGNAETQQRIVKELLATGIKGIAVSPNDPVNSLDFFKNKVNANIPFICQDNDLPEAGARRCYIGTNNYRAGRAAGELVKKAVPDGGEIAIFVGFSDSTNAVERRQGVLDVLAGIDREEMGEVDAPGETNLKKGKYILVETKTDEESAAKCQNHAKTIIARNPNIKCLIGLWEYNPPALIRAVGGNKIAIVGFDENFETLEGIQAGTVIGTVVQNPFRFGELSVTMLKGLAEGKEVKDMKSVLKESENIDDKGRIFIPHRVVTLKGGEGTIPVGPFFEECKSLLKNE